MSRICVVGAGVVGLTCALRLLEAGHRVDVLARDLPLETTSSVAAAIWSPYRALPQDRVTAWAGTSYAVFDALSDTDPDSGIRMLEGTEVFAGRQSDPWWRRRSVAGPRDLAAARVRRRVDVRHAGDRDAALPAWLIARVEALGGTVTRLNLKALPTGADLVVNCSGLGARLLGADRTWCRSVARSSTSSRSAWIAGGSTAPVRPTSCRARGTSSSVGPRRGGRVGPRPSRWPGRSPPGDRAGARAPRRARAPAQGGAAPGASGGPARAGRRRRPLLRPRGRGGDPQLGCRRRGHDARRLSRSV